MTRERVAHFLASIKEPKLHISVKNAINYRRNKKWSEEAIYSFLSETFTQGPQLSQWTDEGSAALNLEPLNSDLDLDADEEVLEESLAEGPPSASFETWHAPEPSRSQIDAEIQRMSRLQVSELSHFAEGVLLEMPQSKEQPPKPKATEPEPPAVAAETRPDRPDEQKEKTAQEKPKTEAPEPSLTGTIFSTLALVGLISCISYYLTTATSALYGLPIATLLVLVPLAFIFFVPQVGAKYPAVALFLVVDFFSVKTLHQKEVAQVSTSALSANPSYQRLKKEHDTLQSERNALNEVTRSSARTQKATDMKALSDKMSTIESAAVSDKIAESSESAADVTFGVRLILLAANALLAHALLIYTKRIDFDRAMRGAFGEKK